MDDQLLTLIDALGYELHGALLHGNPSPNNKRRYERMTHLQAGDLVMEMSTAPERLRVATNEWPVSPQYPHIISRCGIGIFLRETQEPIYESGSEEAKDWEEAEPPEPIPLERVYYIQLLDTKEEFRWSNARFATIIPVEGWELTSGFNIKVLQVLLSTTPVYASRSGVPRSR